MPDRTAATLRRTRRAAAPTTSDPLHTAVAVAVDAYVYALDASLDGGNTWNPADLVHWEMRVTASADELADLAARQHGIANPMGPTFWRIRVWPWPGLAAPNRDEIDALTATAPAAVRTTPARPVRDGHEHIPITWVASGLPRPDGSTVLCSFCDRCRQPIHAVLPFGTTRAAVPWLPDADPLPGPERGVSTIPTDQLTTAEHAGRQVRSAATRTWRTLLTATHPDGAGGPVLVALADGACGQLPAGVTIQIRTPSDTR